ncbi:MULTISPECIES: mycofactocin system FadH/OYE family oxidoreductase 1 [unclassified Rhodococcus (in: high G+C Gram-positive bacteria)]|uniref:mycofactocin system FadH/OYE family oxidoreductase 1 n=1 Tax=unclassified Rhodococcus (in: high G+C Gram-positive bacteria) TaxID=192944 RepID=UPI0016397C40|nr:MULTISPECIES: mycofactocin system FadH/OYE family oxidoreductase 1 [unclassified Rhodococcus (in: high G+C Gram-positive bacteria)]MBC2643296.1 mycofactocin system FadH/OYE family oxidoreductase 1 [Rhodococcus sp. 3A]MBC2891963.1 mycofactocin system FadH/OYE family oxidoreductase 1 [Rhodococcus sp. 4CII]
MSAQLTDPITLAGRHARSRVLLGPHPTNLGVRRGFSPRHVAYYERRARGGAGIVVTEVASVHDSDWPYERAPLASDCVDGWRGVVAACRPHGTLVLAGLGHTGLQGSSAYSQAVLWGPSGVADVISREMPMQMGRAEIDGLVDGFRAAAAAAVAADVDGVEIDAGPRSLLRQFHSDLTNLRDDAYGADPLRLTREVLAAVRDELGPGRVLSLRLSCDEETSWAGITPSIAAGHARRLADALDLLVVVRGGPLSPNAYRPDFHRSPSFNTELCRGIRQAVAGVVPVVLQGSVIDPSDARHALADGIADVVEMTRAQIADPDLVVKIRRGAAPRPCVLCNQTCQVLDPRNPVVTCIGNPSAGHETVDPPGESADGAVGAVLVVGGGPAGLEAARVLALRGRRVTVAEASARLGGMVRAAAATVPHLGALTDWLEGECHSLGVEFRLGSAVSDAELDAAERAGTTVVLATGSRPRPLPFPVDGSIRCLGAAELTDGAALPAGPHVVFDPVGGPIGLAAAEWLAARGRAVSIVTQDSVAGSRLGMTGDLADANARLQRAGVTRHLDSRIVSVGDAGMWVVDRHTGEESLVPCAVLIDCSHRLPEDTLGSTRPDTVRAGDCVAPRTLLEAVREGRAEAQNVTARRRSEFDHHPFTLVNER